MKLTKAQEAVLDAIKAAGYLHAIDWSHSRTTRLAGYPHRITDATIWALRLGGHLRVQVIRPGGTYPDGRLNEYRVSSSIFVPVEGHAKTKDATGSGLERWSCSCGACCLRHPHLSEAEWQQKLAAWLEGHAAPAVNVQAPAVVR